MLTVLVVEDSLTEQKMITDCLQRAGFSVVQCTSSEEAQKLLHSQQPNLMILDVVLPGQSGFEFCRELKNNSATQAMPIIICSTKNTEADKLWGSMLGADAYLSKPLNLQELVSTVQKLAIAV